MRATAVEAVIVDYLREDGWTVTTAKMDEVDVLATRGTELIQIEVKGLTSTPGVDIDHGYGQLMRRMSPEMAHARFVLAVPEVLEEKALRVHGEVRSRLGIEVWSVTSTGAVRILSDAAMV
jgi:hypothetical protein